MRLNYFAATLLVAYMTPPTTLAVSWGYVEEDGPVQWREISKTYATCQISANQSPIDIQTTTTSKPGLPTLNIQCVDGSIRFRNIDHMLQAMMSSCTFDFIEVDETLYYLKQSGSHAPSEYTLNGRTCPLELQLVRKNQSGDIAIVAVMFDTDEPSQAIQSLWESFPTMEDSSTVTFSPVDIHQLLPDNKTYWCYRGSLTTPPCIEGATWTILETPASLSVKRMDKFHCIVRPADSRPLQPLNEYKITNSYSGDTEILYQSEVTITQ